MNALLNIATDHIEELVVVAADIALVAAPVVVVDNSSATGTLTTDVAMMDVAQSFHLALLADPLHPHT